MSAYLWWGDAGVCCTETMDIRVLSQVILNTLMLGGVYVLLAIGLSIIYSIMRVIQFAHGHMYMLGAFAVFFLFGQWGLNYFLTLIITMVMVGLFGVIVERLLFRRVRGLDLPSMIIGIGLLLLLEGAALLAFGAHWRYVPAVVSGVFNFGGVYVPKDRLLILSASVALVVLLLLFIERTKLGQAMRAVAQNRDAALLQGIDVNRISALGFAIGSGLAAVAGGLLLPIAWVDPFVGGPIVIKCFLVLVLGGLGSIPGVLVGGFVFAFIESFGFTYIGYEASVIVFVMVMVVLLIKPQGLLGHV